MFAVFWLSLCFCVCLCVCVCEYVGVFVFVCVYLCVFVCVSMYVCMYLCECVEISVNDVYSKCSMQGVVVLCHEAYIWNC